MKGYEPLERAIGYEFRDKTILETALTHSSYANENRDADCPCNERLEYLGDSVLGFVTADWLYRKTPAIPEGKMSRLRAEYVCEAALHEAAEHLQLGRYLRLGRGEAQSGGRRRPSILADATEALIAALYLDGGLAAASAFIHAFLLTEEIGTEPEGDFKTELQERVQREPGHAIAYELLQETGPDHCKLFTFRVCIDGREAGRGTGHTKKEAEQAAARAALTDFREAP
jgi:ribonuclease-3